MNPEVRIYNKVGSAYGTLTDVAFIQNEKEGIEFFLAATILVNQNQIFNDDLYEYDTVGIPFLAALGEAIYTYELKEKD
jgi:sporulation protein YlmC with PRC-barrel domain